MKRLAVLFAITWLAACVDRGPSSDVTETTDAGSSDELSDSVDPVIACARRGVAYFREIGSYPNLQSAPNKGRAAEDVVLERCQRTTTAFPE